MTCEMRPHLLAAWRSFAKDPDDQPELWLARGAPLGIRVAPIDVGVFPKYVDEKLENDPEEVAARTEDCDGTFYQRLTDLDDDANEEIKKLVDKIY